MVTLAHFPRAGDDDMDDEEDPDFDPKKVKGPKGKGGNPEECKQQ